MLLKERKILLAIDSRSKEISEVLINNSASAEDALNYV